MPARTFPAHGRLLCRVFPPLSATRCRRLVSTSNRRRSSGTFLILRRGVCPPCISHQGETKDLGAKVSYVVETKELALAFMPVSFLPFVRHSGRSGMTYLFPHRSLTRQVKERALYALGFVNRGGRIVATTSRNRTQWNQQKGSAGFHASAFSSFRPSF